MKTSIFNIFSFCKNLRGAWYYGWVILNEFSFSPIYSSLISSWGINCDFFFPPDCRQKLVRYPVPGVWYRIASILTKILVGQILISYLLPSSVAFKMDHEWHKLNYNFPRGLGANNLACRENDSQVGTGVTDSVVSWAPKMVLHESGCIACTLTSWHHEWLTAFL